MFTSRRRQRNVAVAIGLAAVVTPMLDMTFQLLFFFVVNVKPVVPEGQIDTALLAAAQGAEVPVDPDLEKGDEYVIHVNSRAAKDGAKPVVDDVERIAALCFTAKLESVVLPIETNWRDVLEKKLRTIPPYVEGKGKKAPRIVIEVNSKLKYEEVIELLDLCRKVSKERNILDISLRGYPK
jgi:biopolymer transport protein ExbD